VGGTVVGSSVDVAVGASGVDVDAGVGWPQRDAEISAIRTVAPRRATRLVFIPGHSLQGSCPSLRITPIDEIAATRWTVRTIPDGRGPVRRAPTESSGGERMPSF
jgi:hypothetical protein